MVRPILRLVRNPDDAIAPNTINPTNAEIENSNSKVNEFFASPKNFSTTCNAAKLETPPAILAAVRSQSPVGWVKALRNPTYDIGKMKIL